MTVGRHKRRLGRRKQPDFPIRIDRLSQEGRGLVEWGNRILLVDGALPGELVNVRITKKSSRIAHGFAKDIHISSSSRGSPDCAHAKICGGCSLQHISHENQVSLKHKTLYDLIANADVSVKDVVRLPPILGPVSRYRRRARLGVRWVKAKNRVLVGFRERGSNLISDIEACDVLDPRIGPFLSRIEETIGAMASFDQVPQVEVVAGDDVLALVFRHLNPLSRNDEEHLINLGIRTGWHIYLQSKGPETVHRIWPAGDNVYLSYRIGEFGLEYKFKVTDFTQINAYINRKMLIQAIDLLDLKGTERVLDLFCGLGNFTLAVATKAKEVFGVEISNEMVDRVMYNAMQNELVNVSAAAFDLTKPIELESWAKELWDTLIIDPPRSGAKKVLEALPMTNIQRILYVSCNSETLACDIKVLQDRGFRITHLGIIDMFPNTSHAESMVMLTV